MYLDFFTEEELLASPVSEYLGIENIGDKSRKFVLPPPQTVRKLHFEIS